MVAAGVGGSVVTLIADSGDRYADTYYNADWLAAHNLDPSVYAGALAEFERSCDWAWSGSSTASWSPVTTSHSAASRKNPPYTTAPKAVIIRPTFHCSAYLLRRQFP
jgi:hypothetical protein